MALSIYRELSTGSYAVIKQDGSSESSLPVITTHDGVLGEVVETKLYIRNDDPTEYYTNITVKAISKTSPDDTIGTASGHGVKLSTLATQPTEAQWAAMDYGNTISFSDIGASGLADTSSYLSFWYRVEVPAGTPADNKENIILRISYTANAV
jgi:hypothetical protein